MKFKYLTLDKLGTVSRGKSKHRPRNDPKLYGGTYPFIQTSDIKHADLYVNDYEQTYNEEGLAQSKLWDEGTLCITIAANIADTSILGMPACFPDSVMGFVPFEHVSDARYIKYLFDVLKIECEQISQGTAQDNLSWERLSTIKFPVPDYFTQVRIADVLSTYGALIENNRKQIKLLEEAAQRLYKEWFVDLRFPGYESTPINPETGLPEDWIRCSMLDKISFVRGRSYSSDDLDKNGSIKLINLNNIAAFGGWSSGAEKSYEGSFNDDQKVNGGDILLAVTDMTKERRLVGHAARVPNGIDDAIISMDLIKLLPEGLTREYLYCFLRFSGIAETIAMLANGTNVLHLKPDELNRIELLIPSIDCQNNFSNHVSKYFELIDSIEIQNARLAEARDRLLPKLMSGEIEV